MAEVAAARLAVQEVLGTSAPGPAAPRRRSPDLGPPCRGSAVRAARQTRRPRVRTAPTQGPRPRPATVAADAAARAAVAVVQVSSRAAPEGRAQPADPEAMA